MPSVAHSRGGLFPSLQSAVLAAAAIALSGFTSLADATPIVQSVTYDASDYSGSVVTDGFSGNPIADLAVTDTFAPFDPALGTLDAVTVALSLTFQIDWTDPNPTTSPSIGGGVDIVWDRNDPGQETNDPGQETIWGTGGGNGTGPSSSGSLTMSMQTTATTPGNPTFGLSDYFTFDLSDFTSPYTLSIVSDSMTVGGSNGATIDYELASGSLSVTYDFTAVPEPASHAACAVIGALGLALVSPRSRRRASRHLAVSKKVPATTGTVVRK
jgi:hypothetical protein